MGPQSARSYPGRRPVKPAGPKAQRAKQEIDYGRRGKGYVFGAFRPATGDAFTAPYAGRTTANWVDFLGAVEGWINPDVERVYAVVDNLNVHSATDVLLFALAHPRWEFVFQPKKGGRARKGNVHLRTILVGAAISASRTKGSYLRDKFHRLKARRGALRPPWPLLTRLSWLPYHMLAGG